MEWLNDKPVKKLIRSKSGLRIVVTDDDYKSPFVIGEPQWTPDKEVQNCTKCGAKFGFTTRKHHCRRCGNIYCSACCDEKLDLPRMCFVDPVRICNDCAPTTIQENKFFECHLKILTSGASLLITSLIIKSNKNIIFVDNKSDDFNIISDSRMSNILTLCKLSQDHRYLIFEVPDNLYTEDCLRLTMRGPLYLNSIKHLNVFNDVSTPGSTSVELKYTSEDFNFQQVTDEITLSTPTDGQYYKQSHSWILALQQAYKLLHKDHHESSGNNEVDPW